MKEREMPVDPVILIRQLDPDRDGDLPLPQYMTAEASGMDIRAAVDRQVRLDPGQIRLIPTGLAMALPSGFEAQIRPRSGLASRHGVTVVNAPGTIDADYRGEIKVALINLGRAAYRLQRGERIAQMVIGQVFRPHLKIVEQLPDSQRAEGGFGHTGK